MNFKEKARLAAAYATLERNARSFEGTARAHNAALAAVAAAHGHNAAATAAGVVPKAVRPTVGSFGILLLAALGRAAEATSARAVWVRHFVREVAANFAAAKRTIAAHAAAVVAAVRELGNTAFRSSTVRAAYNWAVFVR